MKLRIKVLPRSKKFAVELLPDRSLKVYATQKPEQGKVNAEIIRELGSLLEKEIYITKGSKSRNKVIEVKGDEKEILRRLGKETGS